MQLLQAPVPLGVLPMAARLKNLALGLMLLPVLVAPAAAQANPVQVGEVAIFAPNDVVVSGNLAFVTSGWTSYQLNVVDVSDPTSPTILSTLPLTGRCYGVDVSGTTVVVATNVPQGIHIVDVANPADPQLLTSFPLQNCDVWDVAVSNGMAYVQCDGGPGFGGSLQIVDVSNPSQPVFRSAIYPPGFGFCRTVEVDGNYAYVGYYQVTSGGFRIVDVTDPMAPVHVATVNNPLGSQGGGTCFAENGVAYQALWNKVLTFNVTVPSSPVYLNYVTPTTGQYASQPYGLTAKDNVLYVSGQQGLGSATLNIYDCADPSAPMFLGRLAQPYPRLFGRLAVSGSTAYVVNNPGLTSTPIPGTGSLVVIDTGMGHPPTANAGADFSVDEGQASVALNGSASSDPDNDPLTYAWEQVGAATVTFTGADTVAPSFNAPYVTTNTTLTFRLTVTANGESATDTVDVTVVNVNHDPVADAGDDQSVAEGTLGVALVGSDSYDDDMDTLSYAWLQTGGPTVSLSSTTLANPTFAAPTFGGSGAPGIVATLDFQLTVEDGYGGSATDTVKVDITNVNNAPSAAAGDDQTVDENTPVSLAGSDSSDPDGDALSYSWLQTYGTGVVLTGADTATPSFTAPFVNPGGGELTFALTVSDGYGGSATDHVQVRVQNTNDPPLASAAAPTVGTLWPPTHGLVSVGITGVSDPDNNATIVITAVTQDEPTNGLGDGDTAIDAIINPDGTVLLRAERSGTGNGRVYHVHFTASDPEGSVSGVVTVSVPKSKKSVAVDDGELYDSTN